MLVKRPSRALALEADASSYREDTRIVLSTLGYTSASMQALLADVPASERAWLNQQDASGEMLVFTLRDLLPLLPSEVGEQVRVILEAQKALAHRQPLLRRRGAIG